MDMRTGLEYIIQNQNYEVLSCMNRLYKTLDESYNQLAQMMRLLIFRQGERMFDLMNDELQSVPSER